MTSRSAPPTTPPSSQLSLLALVLGFFVADVGGNGAVWNPSEVWTHYAPRRGEPRHHTHVGCYNNPGGVLDPIFPDGKKTVADLTRDKCLAQCINYPFFGVAGANGDFCACGSVTLASLTPAVGMCGTACSGEPGASCGGAYAMSVYSVTTCSTQASCGGGCTQVESST